MLRLVSRGLHNEEIATELGISRPTVKHHVTAILHKLNLRSRTEVAVFAVRHGWVRFDDMG